MLNNIKLGLLDLWKDKIYAFIYIVFFSCIIYIILSSSISLFRNIKFNDDYIYEKLTTFDTYVIGFNINNTKQIINDLSLIYENNAFTYYNAKLANRNNTNLNTIIIFGDVANYYPYLKSNKDVSVFVGKDYSLVDVIEFYGVEYKVESIITEKNSFIFDHSQIGNTKDKVFIIIKNSILSNWIKEDDVDMIYQLIENTHILRSDKKRILSFIKYTNSNFFKVSENMDKTFKNTESKFIIKIIYPYIFIVNLCCFLSTSIVLDGIIKKRIKEFSLYIIHGANLNNIITRLITFFSVIIFLSILLDILMHFISPHEFIYCFIIGLIISSVFSVMVIYKLKRKNLYINLRNGGNL